MVGLADGRKQGRAKPIIKSAVFLSYSYSRSIEKGIKNCPFMQYTELGETLDCREKRNCITITGN
jgi:hypothetical protein